MFFTFTLNQKSVDNSVALPINSIRKFVKQALPFISDRWQNEIRRQTRANTINGWPPLSPRYAEDKDRLYPGQPTLMRTGSMLDGYQSSIIVDLDRMSVIMPYPDGNDPDGKSNFVKARAHQSVTGRPVGVPERPYDTQPFIDIAIEEFREAVGRSL